MKQLVIYTSPKETKLSKSDYGQTNPVNRQRMKQKHKEGVSFASRRLGDLTPRQTESGSRKVLNLPDNFVPERSNKEDKRPYSWKDFAQDLCVDAGDKYYGHEIN